jgi:sporulation protein YlmC with PRC-barrel domain
MKKLLTTYAALVLSTYFAGPMLAQTTTPPQDQPSSTMPAQSEQQMSPTQGQSTATDLTGQTIYSSKGKKIGTVSAMSSDAQGQQAASVSIEKYMGMGGQTVLIPVSSLHARDGGGYTTTLSSTELKALANSGSASTPTQ